MILDRIIDMKEEVHSENMNAKHIDIHNRDLVHKLDGFERVKENLVTEIKKLKDVIVKRDEKLEYVTEN